jgi:ABC-type multidrug transport system ATPase subunit
MSTQPPATKPVDAPTSPDHLAEDEWPALEVYDVSKRYVKSRPPVLDKVNLTVERGTSVWIGGQNGAGKTTLLRIVSGLIGADEGEIRAFGLHPVRNRREYQRRVGFLSAGNLGIYARLTVKGQLDCWARIAFIPRQVRSRTVDRVMEQFELHPLAEARSDRMSMGQRQRLRLAMTFIGDPDLVLLDEPRTSLDVEGGDMLARAIRDVVARGGAVIWVSPTGDPLPLHFDQRLHVQDGKLISV